MLFRFIPAPLPLLSMCVQPRPDGAVMRPGTKRALPSASAGPLPCPFARGECELKYVECLLQESTNGLLQNDPVHYALRPASRLVRDRQVEGKAFAFGGERPLVMCNRQALLRAGVGKVVVRLYSLEGQRDASCTTKEFRGQRGHVSRRRPTRLRT